MYTYAYAWGYICIWGLYTIFLGVRYTTKSGCWLQLVGLVWGMRKTSPHACGCPHDWAMDQAAMLKQLQRTSWFSDIIQHTGRTLSRDYIYIVAWLYVEHSKFESITRKATEINNLLPQSVIYLSVQHNPHQVFALYWLLRRWIFMEGSTSVKCTILKINLHTLCYRLCSFQVGRGHFSDKDWNIEKLLPSKCHSNLGLQTDN